LKEMWTAQHEGPDFSSALMPSFPSPLARFFGGRRRNGHGQLFVGQQRHGLRRRKLAHGGGGRRRVHLHAFRPRPTPRRPRSQRQMFGPVLAQAASVVVPRTLGQNGVRVGHLHHLTDVVDVVVASTRRRWRERALAWPARRRGASR